jgi:hypothetical protein
MVKKLLIFMLLFLSANVIMAQPGNAIVLDGVNDYISIPDNAALRSSTVTLEAWVKPLNNASAPIIFKPNSRGSNGSYNEGYMLYQSGNKFVAGMTALSTAQLGAIQTNTFTIGKWYHLVGVFTATQVSLYVNGVLQQSTPTGFPIDYSTDPIIIGGKSNLSAFLNIAIDEVRIWNTDRSSFVNADMLNTVSPTASGLVAYYKFDQGIAGGNNAGITTVTDQTANAFNGTLNNSALSGTASNWVESYAMVVPTATAATSVTSSGFTATWTAPAVGTVDNYLLDVSTTADFSAPISGSPFTVAGSSTSKAITGISGGTYYYRVRADKASVTGQGGYSNTISQLVAYTPPGNALNFNGSNTSVKMPTATSTISGSFTVEAWVRPTAQNNNMTVISSFTGFMIAFTGFFVAFNVWSYYVKKITNNFNLFSCKWF